MYPLSGQLVALVGGLTLCACGPLSGTHQIRRTVGGQSRSGIFVSPYSYEHFIRAELAELHGDLRLAAEEYRLARAGPEDDPLLIARLADVLDRLGRTTEAMQLLDQAGELSEDDESVWLTRGRIHQRHGRLDEAGEAFGRAVAAAPASEAGPLALAALLRERGQAGEADAALERYLARARGAGAARARLALAIDRRDPLAAAGAVRALLEAAPARGDEVRAAARTAFDGGHPELALRLLSALPDGPGDRELRLRAMIEARAFERAEGLLARWMPDGPDELVRVASGYLAIGMPERALELGRVAVTSEGGPLAHLIVGRALLASGHPAEAAEVLAQIEPGTRAWPDAPIELAHALRRLGHTAVAAETLAHAQARSGHLALQLELSRTRRAAGLEEPALRALAGDDVTLRAARARLLDDLGRHEDAASAYAEIPADSVGVNTADRVRAQAERALRDGDRPRALALMRARVEKAPEDRLAQSRLAALERSVASD